MRGRAGRECQPGHQTWLKPLSRVSWRPQALGRSLPVEGTREGNSCSHYYYYYLDPVTQRRSRTGAGGIRSAAA